MSKKKKKTIYFKFILGKVLKDFLKYYNNQNKSLNCIHKKTNEEIIRDFLNVKRYI